MQRRLLKKMANGVWIIKAGIGVRLLREYKKRFSDDTDHTAEKLAAAVSNEVFCDLASTEESELWLSNNRQLVNSEIMALAKDPETCEALTQSIRVKTMFALYKGERDRQVLNAGLEKLKAFGLFLPGCEMPSPQNFFPIVQRYYSEIKT